jgi:glycosyltransferase involved in cell wall biosynthesis
LQNDNFFSIITVVRDDLEGLKISRESLISQTYGQWMHIVIDGSSTGETLDYLRSLSEQNTVYLSELDNGIYSAMNKGWKLALANSFVFYLNARDKFTSGDSLANANHELKMHENAQWGCTTHEEINRDGSGWICKLVSEPDIRNQLYAFGYRSHQAVVMRASLIKELGGFNEKYRIAADWDLIVRAILHSKPAEWQKPLAVFELGGESSMKMIEAHRELMELRKIYLPRTISIVFYEYLWRAIYLRSLGYVNIFTPIIKLTLAIDFSRRSQLAARRIIKSLRKTSAKKNKGIVQFFFILLKPLQLLSGERLIGYLHSRLSLKPLK